MELLTLKFTGAHEAADMAALEGASRATSVAKGLAQGQGVSP